MIKAALLESKQRNGAACYSSANSEGGLVWVTTERSLVQLLIVSSDVLRLLFPAHLIPVIALQRNAFRTERFPDSDGRLF